MLGSAQTRQADNNVLARHKRKTSGPSIAIAIVFFSFEVTRNSFDILNGLQYFWRYMHKVMQPRWVYGSDTHATNRFHHYQAELSYCSCCLHRFAGVICILPNVLTRKLCLLWRNVCQRSHWTPPSKEKRSFPGYWAGYGTTSRMVWFTCVSTCDVCTEKNLILGGFQYDDVVHQLSFPSKDGNFSII